MDFVNKANGQPEDSKDKKLSAAESDKLYFDLVEFLIENQVFWFTNKIMEYMQDKESQLFYMTKVRCLLAQHEGQEAVEAATKLLQLDETNQKAWILKGHSYFIKGNLFDSDECYIRALQLKPTPKCQVLQERLGLVYARRKAWKDSKIVFLKCCKEFTSTTSWIYLGLSMLRLGEMAKAEDALTQANILDNLNPKVWGYLCVLCLNSGPERNRQAETSLHEAIRMNLEDFDIFEEIGDLYKKQSNHDLAILCYQKAVECNPEFGEGWEKLGEAHCDDTNQN
jgi:tetratricopeptide (TPR) repeat protein